MRRKGDSIQIPGDYQYRALHQGWAVQRYWHRLKFKVIDEYGRPEPGMRILDLGCGSGVIADYLASRGAETVGVDVNPQAIQFASANFTRSNLSFQLGLVDELQFPPGCFDQIYLLEILEHLFPAQTHELLCQLRMLLRPGGRLVLTTPNYRSLWPLIEVALDWSGLVPRLSGEQHVSKWTAARLRALAAACGYRVERLGRGFGLAPFSAVCGGLLADTIGSIEDRLGNPFGALLCACLKGD